MKKETSMKKPLRILSILLAVLMVSGLFTACGKPQSDVPPAEETEIETPEKVEQEMDTIVTAEGTDYIELDKVTMSGYSYATLTPFTTDRGWSNVPYRWMYDRLAIPDENADLHPQGAKSWSVAEDGKTWSVEIYDFIYDSQGNHITASDVCWFINEYIKNPLKPCFNQVKEAKVTGDYTLEVVLNNDNFGAFETVLQNTYLVSQSVYESDPDGFAFSPVTTSPYVVTDFVPNEKVVFAKRDDYWMTEDMMLPMFEANVKEIEVLTIAEASQQQIALETGSVDLVANLSSTLIDNFKSNDAFSVIAKAGPQNMFLMFSGDEHSVLANDVNLRKAICYAIDVPGLIKGGLSGYSEPAYDVFSIKSEAFQEAWKEEAYYPYDTALAKECLKASNYDGSELSFMVSPSWSTQATIIQAYCQAVGINLKLNVIENALYNTYYTDGRQYDLTVSACGSTPTELWNQFLNSNVYETGDSMGRKDPVLTDMILETSRVANFTPENINAIREYVRDNMYMYGLYSYYKMTVVSNSLGIAEPVIGYEGLLDIAACKFVAVD